MVSIQPVLYGQLSDWLPHCLPHLRKPQEHVADRTSLDDVVRGLYEQSSFLVTVTKDEKLLGCLTFCFQNYPLSRYLCITMFGGDNGILGTHGDEILAFFEGVAKDQQCKGVEWIGRTGWRNWAKDHGFEPFQVVYKKDLT